MTLIILSGVVVIAAGITAALVWADQRPARGEISRRKYNELDSAMLVQAIKRGKR